MDGTWMESKFFNDQERHSDSIREEIVEMMKSSLIESQTEITQASRNGFRQHRHHRLENPETHHPIRHSENLHYRSTATIQPTWPVKKEAVVEGNLLLGGLMMVHEREDSITCGPIMPQGGIQALEAMLYTLDKLNEGEGIIPGVKIGAHILDDCDKDTYGLEMAVDFIKGKGNKNNTTGVTNIFCLLQTFFSSTFFSNKCAWVLGDATIFKNNSNFLWILKFMEIIFLLLFLIIIKIQKKLNVTKVILSI